MLDNVSGQQSSSRLRLMTPSSRTSVSVRQESGRTTMVKDFAYLGELGKQRLYLLAATSLTAATDLTTATFEGPRIT